MAGDEAGAVDARAALWRTVMESGGDKLRPSDQEDLRALISRTASSIDENRLAEAIVNTRRLTVYMTKQFRKSVEPTLTWTLRDLCPLWPFC